MEVKAVTQKLRVDYKSNLNRLKQDRDSNALYADLPGEILEKVDQIIEAFSKEIETLFIQIDKVNQEIDRVLSEIPGTTLKKTISSERFRLVTEHYELVSEFELLLKKLEARVTGLKSPLFGCLEVIRDGRLQRYFIGKSSLIDSNMNVLVSDWRSQIGSIFYQEIKRDERFTIEVNKTHVEYTLQGKMMLTYRDCVLTAVTDYLDDKYNIGEIFTKALADRRGGKFKDIIATIQADQSIVINRPSSEPITIQGCAGSGKTSIAIHRISKILFDSDKNLIKPQGVWYVTPNDMFADYLEDVKTSLGLEGVRFQTYLTWAINLLFRGSNPYVGGYIYTPKLVSAGKSYKLDQSELKRETYKYVGNIISTGIKLLLAKVSSSSLKRSEFKILLSQLNEEFDIIGSISRLIELFTQVDPDDVEEEVSEELGKLLYKLQFFEICKEIFARSSPGSSYSTEIRISEINEDSEQMKRIIVYFSLADIPVLLMMREIVYGNNDQLNEMIVIDEAQNYTQEEIESMLRFTSKNRFLAVGDIHQQSRTGGIKEIAFSEDVFRDFSTSGVGYEVVINTCYRTTKAIMQHSYKPFGDQVIDKYRADKFFREGDPVKVYSDGNPLSSIEETLSEAFDTGYSTVAIVGESETLQELRSSLTKSYKKNKYELLPINDNNYKTGVFFLEEDNLSGLEFDLLIYVGDTKPLSQFSDWNTASKYHVIMTRAMHQLVLITKAGNRYFR